MININQISEDEFDAEDLKDFIVNDEDYNSDEDYVDEKPKRIRKKRL